MAEIEPNHDYMVDCKVRIVNENNGCGWKFYAEYMTKGVWKKFQDGGHGPGLGFGVWDKSFSNENQASEYIENQRCKIKPKLVIVKEY